MSFGKEWLVRAGFSLAALTVGLPIVNFEHTQRVVGVLVGEDVSCGDDIEPKNQQYPYDAIVVPGAGRWLSPGGIYEPTKSGKLRLQAAAIAWAVDRLAPIIILLNGASLREEDKFTEVKYLQGEVRALTGDDTGIPDEAILIEDRSTNTATNMQELARMTKEYGLQKVVTITNDFHVQRATLFACANGVSASGLPAEDVIVGMYPERAEELAGWYDTKQMQAIQAKELAEIILIPWDPKGYVPTWLRSVLDS